MPLPDSNITLWTPGYPGVDTNIPLGSDIIGTNLDDQFRVIKSVARAESINKSWERWKGLYGTLTFVDTTHFRFAGDQVTPPGPCIVGRRIKATVTAGTVEGYITIALFDGVNTNVTVVMDGASVLDAGLSEVQFGIMVDALPQGVLNPTNNPNYVVAAGTDTYTAALSPAITAYIAGVPYYVQFVNPNTGASTLNLNGLGAIAIKKNVSVALVSGDLVANIIGILIYDGTNFQLVGVATFGGAPLPSTTQVQMGVGTGYANLGGEFSKQVGSVGNLAGGANTTLFTATFPANSFDVNGRMFRLTVMGTAALNGDSKHVRISTAGFNRQLGLDPDGSWSFIALGVRASATSIWLDSFGSSSSGSAGANTLALIAVPDLAINALTIGLVGASSQANNLVAKVFILEFIN